MAGHVASAAEERCSDCVYEIGQSLTEMVDIWGENSGIGAVSGRVRSGDSTAELSNMPGMTVASAHRAPGGRSTCPGRPPLHRTYPRTQLRLAVFLSVYLRTYHLCGGGLLHWRLGQQLRLPAALQYLSQGGRSSYSSRKLLWVTCNGLQTHSARSCGCGRARGEWPRRGMIGAGPAETRRAS